MSYFIAITTLIMAIYCVYVFRMTQAAFRKYSPEYSPSAPTVAYLIPFRNEASRMKGLIASLQSLQESERQLVYAIDDHSTDTGRNQLQETGIHLCTNGKNGKKAALLTGIAQSSSTWIHTLDADIAFPKNFMQQWDKYRAANSSQSLLAGPVKLLAGKKWYQRLELVEHLALQTLTAGHFERGKPIMCNGANLTYLREAFYTVDGFKGNEHLISGDDGFLLEKMVEAGLGTHFVADPSVTVATSGSTSISGLIKQKVRWAAKLKAYNSNLAKWVGILLFLSNAVFIIALPLAAYIPAFAWLVVGKLTVDMLAVVKAASFFNQRFIGKSLVWYALLYPFYHILIGLFALVAQPTRLKK